MKIEKMSLIDKYYKSHNAQSKPVQSASVVGGYIEQGQVLSRKGRFEGAVNAYRQVLAVEPENYEAQFQLAKNLKLKEDYKSATKEFEKCLILKPDDSDAKIALGDCYRQQGFYAKAIDLFSEVSTLYPENDLAQRNLKEAQNQLEFVYAPQKAFNKLNAVKANTINSAIAIAKQYLPEHYTDTIQDIKIGFDETQKLSGFANIAQYEYFNKKISISNDYIWANPRLVAAYLTHEFVHAKDKDPYTSIKEEQDAFFQQAEYWKKNGNGISDPEMDYILELYEKSPKALAERVRTIYKLRDENIAETSPNHPSANGASSLTQINMSEPLKYNAIA